MTTRVERASPTQAQHLRHAIDMPGHEVAAQGIAGAQRRLEIDRVTWLEIPEGREVQRLARDVGRECIRR